MPRAYIPHKLVQKQKKQMSRHTSHPDFRVDNEPHLMLTLDNNVNNVKVAIRCNFAPICFECPLSKCKYDINVNVSALFYLVKQKDTILEVGRRYEAGESALSIAEDMDIQNNNVYRWAKKKIWRYLAEWNS